jgi:hypothetical protein
MNTFICRESQLGYTDDYFELTTDAEISDVQNHNVIRHRADWVSFLKLVENLKIDGFECSHQKIKTPKPYCEYNNMKNFIELRYGNY